MRFKLWMEAYRLDSSEWDFIVARLGGAAALTESARRHKAFQRPRGVRSATDLLRLAMLYGPGGRSLRMLAADLDALAPSTTATGRLRSIEPTR